MDTSCGNSFLGASGYLAPADDPRVRSLPPILRLAIPGFTTGWAACWQ